MVRVVRDDPLKAIHRGIDIDEFERRGEPGDRGATVSGSSVGRTSRPSSTATSDSAPELPYAARVEGSTGFEARRRGQVAEDRLAAHDLLHLGDVQADLPADVRCPGIQLGAARAVVLGGRVAPAPGDC